MRNSLTYGAGMYKTYDFTLLNAIYRLIRFVKVAMHGVPNPLVYHDKWF